MEIGRAPAFVAAVVLSACVLAFSAAPAAAECTPAKYGTPGCPYPSFGGSGSETFRANTDRPGSDYTSFDLNGNSPGDCQNACQKDGRCRAWTFVKSGYQGPKARCWLKTAIPGEVANNCCVSGRKSGPLKPGPKPLRCYEDMTDYGMLGGGPPPPCLAPLTAKRGDACMCSGFTYKGIVR